MDARPGACPCSVSASAPLRGPKRILHEATSPDREKKRTTMKKGTYCNKCMLKDNCEKLYTPVLGECSVMDKNKKRTKTCTAKTKSKD